VPGERLHVPLLGWRLASGSVRVSALTAASLTACPEWVRSPPVADISESVRRFIAQHVHSAGQLEVLLLLRAVPDREWSVEDVARAQVSTPVLAEQMLEDLRRRGLVQGGDEPRRYRYAPPPELGPVIDDLAEAYATRRVTVVGLIFSKPSSAVTELADAFRIRKDR